MSSQTSTVEGWSQQGTTEGIREVEAAGIIEDLLPVSKRALVSLGLGVLGKR